MIKKIITISNAKIISLAIIKILGFFFLAKISLKYFGAEGFVGFSQLQQLLLIMLPTSTLFLQLAISRSLRKNISKSSLELVSIARIFSIIMALIMLLGIIFFPNDAQRIAKLTLGINLGPYIFLFPFSVITLNIHGVFSALLIGNGDSKNMLNFDLLSNIILLALALLFLLSKNEFLFILVPLFSIFAVLPFIFYYSKNSSIELATKKDKKNKFSGYFISSLLAAFSAPMIMYIFRAILVSKGGVTDAAEFILIQKIIAAVLMPVMIYLNNFIQPRYFIASEEMLSEKVYIDIFKITAFGIGSIFLVAPFLGFLESKIFKLDSGLSVQLYLLIGFSEIFRNISINIAYVFNVKGKWKQFILSEILFIVIYSVLLYYFPSEKISFGYIYLLTNLIVCLFYIFNFVLQNKKVTSNELYF